MKPEVRLSKLLPVLPDALIDAVCDLVPDPEEAVVIRRGFVRDIERLEEGERAAIQYVSTRDIDRDNEILDPRGAILDQFRLAPQVLWGHDYSSPPIGSDEWIRMDDEGRGIIAKTRYASTDRAREIFTLKQEGHLRTQSVGFVPIEYVEPDGPGWAEATKRLGKRWGVTSDYFDDVKRIHTKWLMLEHSDVSVPSNINALQLAVSKGLEISPALQKELGIKAETFECECIECGHKITSEKHCKDLKCPKCGAQMRRAERPGPGQAAFDIDELPEEPIPAGKPYPNEHACRLRDPSGYDRFRRAKRDHNGKTYSVIYGIKNNKAEEQAYRYPKGTWGADEARSHCKSHKGSFEAAASEEQARIVLIERQIEMPKPPQILRKIRRMRLAPEPMDRKYERLINEAIARERGRV